MIGVDKEEEERAEDVLTGARSSDWSLVPICVASEIKHVPWHFEQRKTLYVQR